MTVVTTKIVLEIEIDTDSNWSPEATVKQVKKQSVDSAMSMLNRAFRDMGARIKVTKDPKCLTLRISE